MNTYFIAGTDTGVGKTVLMCALIHALQTANHHVTAYKPLTSGAVITNDGLRNHDVLQIQKALAQRPAYHSINQWTYAPAISPHISAALAGDQLDAQSIAEFCQPGPDITLIEGVGGWLAPINEVETMADVASLCQAKIILVVGIRLGCINHSLLTAQSICHTPNSRLIGWIANIIAPDVAYPHEQIKTINKHLNVPLLATVPFQDDFNVVDWHKLIDIKGLTNEYLYI